MEFGSFTASVSRVLVDCKILHLVAVALGAVLDGSLDLGAVEEEERVDPEIEVEA